MFGEYAQIASYLPSSRDSVASGDFVASNLPPHLIPVPPTLSPPPWPGAGGGGGRGRGGRGSHDVAGGDRAYVEDFVMVAEFSEIEGPKPVLTIPKDAGSSVDKNSLSVKLMAVDHQTSSEGFSISEDTQVVLSDDESGVWAFVHHFVLYDNQARGFVRPYCMVFISTDFRKIMMFYEELSSQFKRAARFLKYGNRLLFVKDLERHLQDLDHTKGYLLNQVGRTRLKDFNQGDGEQSKARTNAENELYKGLQNIQQSSSEIRDILSILKPILHDHRLESRFRALEERAFHGGEDVTQLEKLSLQEDWFSDHMYSEPPVTTGSFKESFISPVSLFKSATPHTPLLVETKKAKRFNCPLRGLHELCSWGAREGLRKLRCILEYFKRDIMILELERNESRLMEPPVSMVLHGHCITSNVLSGVFLRGSPQCMSEDSSSLHLSISGDKLRRRLSIASNDTLESFKSVESYLSLGDDENASLYSFVSNNSSNAITTSASAQDFLSAPTSPMTEEVAFPSSPPPAPTTPSITTTTTPLLPHNTTTTTTTTTTGHQPAKDCVTSSGGEDFYLPPSSTPCPVNQASSASGGAFNAHPTFSQPSFDSGNGQFCAATTSHTAVTDTPVLDSAGESGEPVIHVKMNYDTMKTDDLVGVDSSDSKIDPSVVRSDSGMSDVTSPDSTSNDASECHHQNLLSNHQNSTPWPQDRAGQKSVGGVADCACDADNTAVHSSADTVAGSTQAVSHCGSDSGQDEFTDQGNHPGKGDSGSVSQLEASLESSEDSSQHTLTASTSSGGRGSVQSARMPSFVPIMERKEQCEDVLPGTADRRNMEFTESFKSNTDSITSADDSCCEALGNSACHTQSASTPSSESCLWKPRNGVYTSGDVISSLGPGKPGHGLHEVLMTYQHLHPVIFSLMTGRTVLVVGPARMEVEVTKVVTALSVFLPETKRKQHCVVDWMNRPLKVTDLTRVQLAGICRSEKRCLEYTIPTAVKQYSTLMDVDRRVIIGPPYQGTMLNNVLQQKKSFKTDAQHVAFIHSWLMELSNKAFIFYHSFCLGEAGGLTHGHGVQKHREQYSVTVSCLMNRLGVRDHDIAIIEHMVEKIKLSQLEPHIWANVEKGCVVQPLTILSRATQTFRC